MVADQTKFKYWRRLNGKTQQEIADLVGCSRRFIIYVEQCERQINEEMEDKILNAIFSK